MSQSRGYRRAAARALFVVVLMLVSLVYADAASWADAPSVTVTYSAGDAYHCTVTVAPSDTGLSPWDLWSGPDEAGAALDSPGLTAPSVLTLTPTDPAVVWGAAGPSATPAAGSFVAFDAASCTAVIPTPSASPTAVSVEGLPDLDSHLVVGFGLVLFFLSAGFVISWKR